MLNGATLDGQPHLLEFLIGNLKWLTTNNPFQCISFDHVLILTFLSHYCYENNLMIIKWSPTATNAG